MKRFTPILTALVLALAGFTPILAGDKAETSTLEGWIVDSDCGAKNANAAGAECAKACIKGGAKAVLVVGGKTYNLSDQKSAAAHAGHEVTVTGSVDKDGNIAVEKIVPVERAKKA